MELSVRNILAPGQGRQGCEKAPRQGERWISEKGKVESIDEERSQQKQK
jgi:hypothetical protein